MFTIEGLPLRRTASLQTGQQKSVSFRLEAGSLDLRKLAPFTST